MQNVLPSINALLITCDELIFIIYFPCHLKFIFIYEISLKDYLISSDRYWKKRNIQSKSNVEKLVHAFVILRM